MGWFYGLQIVGDPMIVYKKLPEPGATYVPTAPPTPVTLSGDTNGDGNIDVVDALIVAQCYVGISSCPATSIADVNCDGIIDIVDALLIAQYYVGLISYLGC